MGHSNVGKSSLINGLTNQRIAASSKTPGKTKEIHIFSETGRKASSVALVDCPGYGEARVSHSTQKSWKYLMEEYMIVSKW